jgi:hypothetical protein
MRSQGFFSTKNRVTLSGSGVRLQMKSFSPNASDIRCRMASEQFKKEEHRGSWTHRFPESG